MPSTDVSIYWRATRAPRYSLIFAFPLLLAYELLAFTLSAGDAVQVRNGADVLLKTLFVTLGGRYGLALFGVVLIGGGLALVWRDVRRAGPIRPRYFAGMAAESLAYAILFGGVVATVTGLLLPRLSILAGAQGLSSLGLLTQLMISLGAGIYEELLFRVVLVSGLLILAMRVFRWSRTRSGVFAVVLGALIFSGFHYIGPFGEPFGLYSFTFRMVAGLLFSGLYVVRGFGITAWTHALYDVMLAV
jgi:Type II CAAX prenyl endopeptidase Rce1-like